MIDTRTADQKFRDNDEKRQKLRSLLDNKVMQEALLLVESLGTAGDALVNAEAITSVRALSQQHGWRNAIQALHTLSEPREPEQDHIEEDYGVTEPANPTP